MKVTADTAHPAPHTRAEVIRPESDTPPERRTAMRGKRAPGMAAAPRTARASGPSAAVTHTSTQQAAPVHCLAWSSEASAHVAALPRLHGVISERPRRWLIAIEGSGGREGVARTQRLERRVVLDVWPVGLRDGDGLRRIFGGCARPTSTCRGFRRARLRAAADPKATAGP